MKVIGYIVAGFLCLAFVPIAFPILIIVAIVHMLDGKKKARQKKVIVEALKEAGVSPQATKTSAPQKQKPQDPLPLGRFLGISLIVFIVGMAVVSEFKKGQTLSAPTARAYSSTERNNAVTADVVNTKNQSGSALSSTTAGPTSSSAPNTAKTYSAVQICSAAMAAIMGRQLDIMKAAQGSNGIVGVSYVRSQDNKTFEYGCKVEGDKVIWRAKLDGNWGRWRDSTADAVIKYRGDSKGLTIFEGPSDTTYPASKF